MLRCVDKQRAAEAVVFLRDFDVRSIDVEDLCQCLSERSCFVIAERVNGIPFDCGDAADNSRGVH